MLAHVHLHSPAGWLDLLAHLVPILIACVPVIMYYGYRLWDHFAAVNLFTEECFLWPPQNVNRWDR